MNITISVDAIFDKFDNSRNWKPKFTSLESAIYDISSLLVLYL